MRNAKIVILASGQGSGFSALAQAFPHHIAALISNIHNAPVLAKAQVRGIPAKPILHRDFASRSAHETALVEFMATLQDIVLVVLSGYMRVLSPTYFACMNSLLPGVVTINIHPAHLDEYRGAHGFEAAAQQKRPRWGLSVHEVTPELDAGPLLNYTEIPVFPWENASNIRARAQPFEHKILVETVERFLTKARRQAE